MQSSRLPFVMQASCLPFMMQASRLPFVVQASCLPLVAQSSRLPSDINPQAAHDVIPAKAGIQFALQALCRWP